MPNDVFLEFHSIGAFVRVTAIDPVSGVEVVLQGPASAGEKALGDAAIRKLQYVLTKRAAEKDGER